MGHGQGMVRDSSGVSSSFVRKPGKELDSWRGKKKRKSNFIIQRCVLKNSIFFNFLGRILGN